MKREWVEEWNVKAAAILTAIMGLVNMFSGITPALMERLRIIMWYSPFSVRQGSRLSAVIAGFALLMLARNLWRRKRIAWLLTFVTLLLSIAGHLLKGLDYEEAILAGALALWLLILYPSFHAHSDPPSIGQGLWILGSALGFTMIYGVAGFYLLDRHFSVDFGFWAAFRQTLIMFTAFYDPGLEPITGYGRYFAASIYTVGAVSGGYAFLMLARPVFMPHATPESERERARQIVTQYGHSPLARFTLFRDKRYYFSSGGVVIAYVVKGRIALVLGDPIGPAPEMGQAIAGFKRFCRRNDWLAAFYQAQPQYLPLYKQHGYHSLLIGHDPIVDLASFTLAGNANKSLRTPVNRLTRLGFQAKLVEPPLPAELLTQLRLVSDEWLTLMQGSEKQFSLGWFDHDYIQSSTVIVIYRAEGEITAFANLVPEYQRNEISIDLMRRRANAEPGTMEFLLVHLFQWARARGYATFNLGLSALAGVGKNEADPVLERAIHFICGHINQYYNFKGVHSFKEKFHPHWSPRYLIYPGQASLPPVLSALIRADSGDDFWWRLFGIGDPEKQAPKPEDA